MQTNRTVKKSEMWRKYKGKTAEEMCAAIREIWLAKYPDYIRMLTDVPNRLIEQVAEIAWRYDSTTNIPHGLGEHASEFAIGEAYKLNLARSELRYLERFLDKQPFADHFVEDDEPLDSPDMWANPDAPLGEYIEADKRRDALVKKFAIRPNEHAV